MDAYGISKALVHSNQLYVLGGIRGSTYLNDVWFSQPTFTNMLGSFYLYQKQ